MKEGDVQRPPRQGYKMTELGVVPEEWGISRIGDFTDVLTGGTPSTNNREYWGGEMQWATSSDIHKRRIYDVDGRITSLGIKQSNCKLLPKNSVLVALNGQGQTRAMVALLRKEMTCSQSLAAITPSAKHCPEFVYFDLDFRYSELRNLTGDTGRAGLNLKLIRSIRIPMPPLPEQHKIADILSTVDESIHKTQVIIEQSQRVKKGLMQQLLARGIGHTRFKESPLGEIPEVWEIRELSDITDIRYSSVNKKSCVDEIPVRLCNYMDVYCNEYISKRIDFMEATATESEIDKFSLKIGDVIITKDSETPDDIAKPTVVIEDLKNVLCGYHLALLRPNRKIIDGIFLSRLLQSATMNNQFIGLAQGLTRFGIDKSSIEKTIIFVPPLSEQQRIADILSNLDHKIQEEKAFKGELERVKRGLMQVLLTGKVRVKADT